MTISNTTGSDTTDSVCHWLYTLWTIIAYFYYHSIAYFDFFLSTEVVVAESVVVIKKLLQLKVKTFVLKN